MSTTLITVCPLVQQRSIDDPLPIRRTVWRVVLCLAVRQLLRARAVQSDGRIVVAGTVYYGSAIDFGVAHYLSS